MSWISSYFLLHNVDRHTKILKKLFIDCCTLNLISISLFRSGMLGLIFVLYYLACLNFLVIWVHPHFRLFNRRSWSKPRKVSRSISMVSRKMNKQGDLCNEGMLPHILWWKEVLAKVGIYVFFFSPMYWQGITNASALLLLLFCLMFSENGEVQETIINAIDSETCVFKYFRIGSNFKKWKVNQMLMLNIIMQWSFLSHFL